MLVIILIQGGENMTLGEKIKMLRKENGYTQEELADYAGTKKQTIHKYETGIIENIPASKIKLIAEKLETTPAYLMGWEDESDITKKNDTIADIILRLESDDVFLEITQLLYKSSVEQLNTFKTILLALEQQNVD